METWGAVRSRRNVRQYTDQSIPRADLERVLEAGRRAPSASNWQPRHFVVATPPAQLAAVELRRRDRPRATGRTGEGLAPGRTTHRRIRGDDCHRGETAGGGTAR